MHLKDRESILPEEDINWNEHSDRMTIDDSESDQFTNSNDSDSQQTRALRQNSPMKRQISIESCHSSAYSGYSSDNDSGRLTPGSSPVEKFETDAGVLARRERQIKYGKNTANYNDYIKQIPK